jgi:hypothetical protein
MTTKAAVKQETIIPAALLAESVKVKGKLHRLSQRYCISD